jgi:hypothetical protein
MLTEKQKKELKKYVGKQYTHAIIQQLALENILNSHGNPYSNKSILDVVSGISENFTVEQIILKVIKNRKKLAS